jgi:hypothetical protein
MEIFLLAPMSIQSNIYNGNLKSNYCMKFFREFPLIGASRISPLKFSSENEFFPSVATILKGSNQR